jgi:AAA-like domain
MRCFSSYGPVDRALHYYAPREALIESAYSRLVGEDPAKGGHYITVWSPRQCGKTWVMQEVNQKIKKEDLFHIAIISIESAKKEIDEQEVVKIFTEKLSTAFQIKFPPIKKIREIAALFTKQYFQKPVILIIDEFDALAEEFINSFAGIFRDIFINRGNEKDKESIDKSNLLHSMALIGVRSVLGIENVKGSPFNVQRSLHIPNLTENEVKGLFQWYQKESNQQITPEVNDRIFYETRGQPGLTCWFGELLTETYNQEKQQPIAMAQFKYVYKEATNVLPNNNIINIISKAKQAPYNEPVLELFKTGSKIQFRFDDRDLNYLYMNGIIDLDRTTDEKGEPEVYCKFSSPFVQGRLFNYFAGELFGDLGLLVHPMDNMDDAVSEKELNIPNIIDRYKTYLQKVKDTVFKGMPRRKTDKRVYEAVYHFNVFRYLYDLLSKRGISVIPEFPTGNGKIDLILKYKEHIYAIELKSFRDMYDYHKGIEQAAGYGSKMNLKEIVLLVFVELEEEEIKELRQDIDKNGTKVKVIPIGVL